MDNLKLIFVDLRGGLCDAWEEAFADLPNLEVVNRAFESLPAFDCMVSAANSFGIMDGGVDAAITAFFGTQVMRRVQQAVVDRYLGEQPVGTSMIVETGHKKHPFLALTPTMRVPMPISRTDTLTPPCGQCSSRSIVTIGSRSKRSRQLPAPASEPAAAGYRPPKRHDKWLRPTDIFSTARHRSPVSLPATGNSRSTLAAIWGL